MLEVCPIGSLEDPRLAVYRTMRRQFDHFEQELFVAEGEKVVRRLLESSISVISVLMPEPHLAQFKALLQQRPEQVTAFVAPKATLEQLTGFSMYQGVLGVAKVPAPSTLRVVVAASQPPRLLVALDGLSNAENLGVVVRNAVAFGVQGLILGRTCAPPYLRRAVRSSMGTVFKLPYIQSPNLAETLKELRRAGIRIIAAHPHATQRTPADLDLTQECCILFGAEGDGISPEALAACTESAAIPMHYGTDSLNVATASAAFLYEVQRQRKGQQ